ncbi:TadE/TadG family type IV pilus assembly protein [Streptomyces sp. SL13]|uniref:TadE/TadG family type IV pilus assembly protein n=1 Tax=Streptantibioticus silvisoli TaxID=2705255 RepID=A0AA90H0K0_9ACTN|nr:TadE/TadG family type IV pilus assembly protein [Streptantibioticus silvisoli]MDI5969891.1 TadE/TadG family type IV pilus assembly protein [Streptantibioticus silvisoli]
MRAALRRFRDDERGSATVELVLSVGVLLLMLWFMVYCGRLSDSRLRIEDAAHQAARAATLDRDLPTATTDARSAAASTLGGTGVTCEDLAVDITGTMQPGTTVTVTVHCTVDLHDLALLHVPGQKEITATFSSVVDVYRGTDDGGPGSVAV